MKKLYLCTLLIAVLSLKADDTVKSFICEEDQVARLFLDQTNNIWHHIKADPKRYIISKIKPVKPDGIFPKSGLCYDEIVYKRDFKHGDRTLSHGCYNIRVYGTEFFRSQTKMCQEILNNSGELLSVSCEYMTFMPNGSFQRVEINDPMSTRMDEDVASVFEYGPQASVGKCTTL